MCVIAHQHGASRSGAVHYLHARALAHALVTLGAVVFGVLETIDKTGDEATAKPAPKQAAHARGEVRCEASIVLDLGLNIGGATEWAVDELGFEPELPGDDDLLRRRRLRLRVHVARLASRRGRRRVRVSRGRGLAVLRRRPSHQGGCTALGHVLLELIITTLIVVRRGASVARR